MLPVDIAQKCTGYVCRQEKEINELMIIIIIIIIIIITMIIIIILGDLNRSGHLQS